MKTGVRWGRAIVTGLVVNMLSIAFNTWMQIAQPDMLILVEAVNRTIGLMVQAVIVAVVYGRPAQEAGALLRAIP